MEVHGPTEWKNILGVNECFHKTGTDIVLIRGKERVVGVYNCHNFDEQSGRCLDYDNRPDICREAGVKFPPHRDCLLFNNGEKND